MKSIKLLPKEAEGLIKDLKKVLSVKGHSLSFKANLMLASITKEFSEVQKAFQESQKEMFILDEKGEPKIFKEGEHQVHKIAEEKIEDFAKLTEEFLTTEFSVDIRPFDLKKLEEELEKECFSDVQIVSLFMNLDKIAK